MIETQQQQQDGKKKTFNFYPEDEERLERLSEANTGGNQSMMIRRIIQLAMENPKRFGLHVPRGQ